jgi:hypothetical protein
MALIEIQALLARLFTDARLRSDFFSDPIQTARRCGLDDDDAQSLARLDRREVEEFARSLLGKRALDARKILPLTARVLGKDFDALFFEAIDGPPAAMRHRADAAALARILASRRDREPPWIGDLARYEMVFVEAAQPRGALLLRRFDYPIDDILRQLHAGAQPDPAPGARVGIWLRAPGGKLYWRLFHAPRRKA